jgi:hypothetical protein
LFSSSFSVLLAMVAVVVVVAGVGVGDGAQAAWLTMGAIRHGIKRKKIKYLGLKGR